LEGGSFFGGVGGVFEEQLGTAVEAVDGLEADLVIGYFLDTFGERFRACFGDLGRRRIGGDLNADGGAHGVAGDGEGLAEELLDVAGVAFEQIGDDGFGAGVGEVALHGAARDAEGAGGAGDGVAAGELLEGGRGASGLGRSAVRSRHQEDGKS